jgi:hypothetical protein
MPRSGPTAALFFALLLLGSLLAAGTACGPGDDTAEDTVTQDRSITELKSYGDVPRIRLGEIHWRTQVSASEQGERSGAVLALLVNIVDLLDRGDLPELARHVSRSEGLYVDLKAHRSYAEVVRDLADPDGYIRTYYLDTPKLRERTGEPEQLAVLDVLRLTRVVTADVYMQSDGRQCELRLRLEDAPSKSYYLNNPVFILENGRWYIHQLF